ncbi:MAG: BLUF domain-containing protein [Methylophilus sp.]|nr:BLUF domain-containing protein [Methylophilus sp.]
MHQDTQLFMLSYTSIASHLMSHQELIDLLSHARVNNNQRNITGLLLYMEGSFFQVLEGERDVVDALYIKIAQDKRHHHVMKLLEEPLIDRGFANWSMGYQHVSREELAHVTGLTDFLDQEHPGFEGMHSERAETLINAFRQGRWQTRNTHQYQYVHHV